MNKIRLLLVLACIVAQNPAMANDPYMEFQYAYINAEVAGKPLNPSMIVANFGYPVFKYMGLEVVIGAGLREDELKIKSLFGAYLSANIPISYSIDIFGRAGFSSISYEYQTSASDIGASFGLGAALLVGENSAITLEFRTLPNLGSDITLNAIMLGWKYK